MVRNTRLKSVFLKILQMAKSKSAPVIEEEPMISPTILLEKPFSSISNGVRYDIMLSNIAQKNINKENVKTKFFGKTKYSFINVLKFLLILSLKF